MNLPPCQLLDDFLAHDLTGDDCELFIAHLTDCADCHRAVSEYQRLGALLTEATALVPAGLTERVKHRLRAARRRRVAFAAAAMAAMVAVIWLFGHMTPRPTQPKSLPVAVRPEPPAPEMPHPTDQVRVTFPKADMLAVPVKSESPNVTFIQVYPALIVAPKPAPAVDGLPSSPERNAS